MRKFTLRDSVLMPPTSLLTSRPLGVERGVGERLRRPRRVVHLGFCIQFQ